MKKKIIALSVFAALGTTAYADTKSDMSLQLELLKKQIASLEARMNDNDKLTKKNSKKIKKTAKKLNIVKAHDAGDNIKWDVDFRSSVDRINYTHASGKKTNNAALLSNRLLLGMKYKPEDTVSFYGTLSYNKAYGDTANHSQSNTQPGYANFDWVTNENATDNTLKVKEAYWLYMNDTFFGANMPWTASIGRRPSTGGLGINYREGDARKSAIASTVNIEFDGASFKWNTDQVGLPEGSWFKICAGRGLTNAKRRFQSNGADYSSNESLHADSDMLGLIFVPFDNGQYSIHTNYAKAVNMIGFTYSDITDGNNTNNKFKDVGDLELMTAMVKVDGIGDGISDFLDETTFFASFAQSKTDPTNLDGGMLGSTKSETGHSEWIGIQMPCLLTDDGRMGIEWNQGSKYWRSMTYGEDTMSGSKIATRGTAWEVYWLKPLTKSLSMSVRYTKIDYDYTGSQAFFGADGTPTDMNVVKANPTAYGDPVESSSDLRVSMRYKF
jgi:hypothetical protein